MAEMAARFLSVAHPITPTLEIHAWNNEGRPEDLGAGAQALLHTDVTGLKERTYEGD